MKKKSPSAAKPSKEELRKTLRQQERLAHNKALAHKIWPQISGLKSIYDAQTAVNAAAGYIEAAIAVRLDGIKTSELDIDLSKEKKSEIKDAVVCLVALVQNEDAQDAVELLKLFGTHFSGYAAKKYLENPMSVIKEDVFIA